MSEPPREGASPADAPDLTFRATIDLHADCERQATQTGQQRTLVGCVRRLWSDHQTLLVRIALTTFVLLFIALIQIFFPSKADLFVGLFCAALVSNGTHRDDRLDAWCGNQAA